MALLNSINYEAKTDLVKLVSTLRTQGHSANLVAAVMTQAKLRKRGAAKFGEFANQMLFTEAGLEQASRLSVAARHAGRFRNAGITQVADLGCGIAAESLALAAIGIKVNAFEIDEVTAAIAQYNLNAFENASVEIADVTAIDLNSFEALFFDPARRELTGPNRAKAIRKFDPSSFSPNFDWVVEKAKTKPTAIKLGPGHPHDGIPEDCEAQWVSVDGDLVELGLWFGKLARPNVKRAALLITATETFEISSEVSEVGHAPLGELEQYLFEPDNSVVRSHLIALLAEQTKTHSFSSDIAYLTSNEKVDSPWLRGFRVIDNLAFDRKKLKAYLKEKSIGILEIKKRGSDIVPEQLRKELQLKGKNSATLIVTRVAGAHRALICEPL
ncbi:MAG: THUMP-like domain-containing protein [Micrococcales bacterium]